MLLLGLLLFLLLPFAGLPLCSCLLIPFTVVGLPLRSWPEILLLLFWSQVHIHVGIMRVPIAAGLHLRPQKV